ncbi:hypothetical protein PISMIDRAFT_575050 [Pisolithus microcarpus 441]|uniref:Uncharacterized protein n=1 Tax=Pisolithus microcarpus 441 TaxID=765257 RepID=A0A0C9ZLB8_9AGAM|nr:hypothetical protein PISMIDRAFT_575050 [Pisolithus microcarpus 441]
MVAAIYGAVPLFTTAMISISIVWVLSEAYAAIPCVRLCTSECSSCGEYIISSGMEIVVLRGSIPAVSSITHSETTMPFDVLQDVRILVSFVCVILAIFEGLLVESSIARTLLVDLSSLLWSALFSLAVVADKWKYMFSTRTSAAVFALLLSRTEKAEEVMNELLPTPNTRAWKKWKDIILCRIRDREDLVIGTTDWDDGTWTDREREILVGLFQDARNAYEVFQKYLGESVFKHPLV